MSTLPRHCDMGRATFDLTSYHRSYIYRDFTVNGDIPLTVEHLCPDVMNPSKWRTNLDQTLTPSEDGTKLTYTDGYGKPSVFVRKFYYVVKGQKVYVNLADCEEEQDSTADKPHYKRDGYGNYSIKNARTGNIEYTVYERYEDGFGNDVKREDKLLDFLKKFENLDQLTEEKAVYYYADGLRKLEKDANNNYAIELYKYINMNAVIRDNIREDSVILGQFGDYPNKSTALGLLINYEPTKLKSTQSYCELKETALDERNIEKQKTKNVYFVKYPKTELIKQIMRSNFDESFLQTFQSWFQTCEQYASAYEQKIYYKESIETLKNSLSNEKEYYNAITKSYRKNIETYKGNTTPTEAETQANKEQVELLKAQYKPLYNLNNSYLQALEKQKEVIKNFETISLRKAETEQALEEYVKIYKKLPLSILTRSDGTKFGFDYDGRMVSIQEGDKGIYLRYEEGLLRDASDSKGIMATFGYTADGKYDTVESRDGDLRKYVFSGGLMDRIEDGQDVKVSFECYMNNLHRVKDLAGREIIFWSIADYYVELLTPYKTMGKDECENTGALRTAAYLKRIGTAFTDEKSTMYKLGSTNGLLTYFIKTPLSLQPTSIYNKYLNNRFVYSLDREPSPSASDASLPLDQRFFRSDGSLNFANAEVIAFLATAKGSAYNYDSEMRMTKAWDNGIMTEFSKFYGTQPGRAVSTDKYGHTSVATFGYTTDGRLSRQEIDSVVTEYEYNRYGALTRERTYARDNLMLSTTTEYETRERGEEDTGEEMLPYIAPLAGAAEPQNTKAVFSFEGDFAESTSVTAEGEEHGVASNFTAGHLTRLRAANGAQVDFTRDAKGRAVGIKLDGELYATAQYITEAGWSPHNNTHTAYYDKIIIDFASAERLETISLGDQVFERNYSKAGETVNLIKNTVDTDDRLLTHTDFVADEKTTYTYDSDDRMTAKVVTKADGGALSDGLAASSAHFTQGNLNSLTTTYRTQGAESSRTTSFAYTDDANPKVAEVILPNDRRVTYEYDAFGRAVEKRVWRAPRTFAPYLMSDETHLYSQRLCYRSEKGSTQNLIASERYGVAGRAENLTKYTYDDVGRVTGIDYTGKYMVNYTYDSAGRLAREDNGGLGTSVIYTYDGNGNIQYKHEYPYTLEEPKDCCGEGFRHYAYDTVHRDRLVAYEGEFCEYDNLGNPTKYRQKPLKWERCRLLASFDSGVNEVKFTYDGQGQRRTKQAGPRKWRYVYDGTRLVRTVCETVGTVTDIVDFNYDGDGLSTLLWSKKEAGGFVEYEYIVRRNVFGDVTHLYDNEGNVAVEYRYDAWGAVQALTSSDTHGIERVNPILYRGYIYDKETNLYYLNSRYYDPLTGRFLNADSPEYLDRESVYGINLYAYCGGDPVNNVDPSGQSWKSFWSGVGNFFGKVGKFIGGAILALSGAFSMIATLPIALTFPGGGYLTQIGFSTMMYGGFVMGSVFDSQIQNDMNAISWNPFNNDISKLTGESNGRKVSFYKGMPVVWTDHGNGRSWSFMGIWLTGNNDADDINHEWGHGTQQGVMGPIKYLALVGAPSCFEWSAHTYYDRPWERMADIFGGVSRDEHTNGGKKKAWWHFIVSTLFGAFGYLFIIGEY